MQRRSALDSSGLPEALARATPRDVRLNTSGGLMYITAIGLIVVGAWGGIVLGRSAEIAGRRASLYQSERIVTAGDVTQLRKRGGDDGHRITAHYRYTAHGQELMGQTSLRREEFERYVVGSTVAVWYLASEPEASWLDGYAPRPRESWPATAMPIACGLTAFVLIQLVRRQSNLLANGRATMATVTKVEKKKHEEAWMVHYEYSTLTGASRPGKYQQDKKQVPAVGDLIPIVYDRDNSFRHSKYPMGLVKVESKKWKVKSKK